jgi:adenine-specific DNA-methyltransferase
MSAQEPKNRRRQPKIGCAQLTPMPAPGADERPTIYADRVGEWYVAQKSDAHRKGHGLYLTPILAADFMAEQIRAAGKSLRLLDPAAGAGILACAAVEQLVSRTTKPATIELVAYEVDAELIAPLRAVLDYLVEWCSSDHNVALNIRIEVKDFVLEHFRFIPAHIRRL